MNNGDITKATVDLPNSYVVGNTWVGSGGTVTLVLHTGYPIALQVLDATVTMQLALDHRSATHGIVSGVLDPDALAAQFQAFLGEAGMCSGPTVAAFTTQLDQASDILLDGTQDPTKTCDGISVGIGFDAQLVKLGAVQAGPPPPANPCGSGT